MKITGMLGEGKQGKVYSGKWKGVNVAYKVIHLPVEMSKEGKARARAVMELAISATMAHPNVVQTYNYEIVYINTSAVKQTPDADGELLVAASTDKQVGLLLCQQRFLGVRFVVEGKYSH